ncbi:hypothetical protein HMPREF1624_04221 [Sporothrix schenckii ATCC 58251]|uniref:BTB domain transcription factor n=1 Tax=Sporothrix schenckii (strain ATCC 58251 / de Perez 2211183) TaxID=1391915 RepID=U7PVT2_SPOS1|nr:hypothetical protein HMPREF1624_04221 [Sporothrix schenckii ATCC 58251]
MVETRHGTQTTNAPGKAVSSKPETDKDSKDGATKSSGAKVKNEPSEKPSEKPSDNARAGDKHQPADHSQSPKDSRKRHKTAHEQGGADADADAGPDDNEKDNENAPAILEKGNIYFFFRARVDMDDPSSLDDVARTYLVLRPQANDDTDGGGDGKGHTRLLALPKKVLPRTGRDRFMAFVLAADASYDKLQTEFLSGSRDGSREGDGDGDGDKQRHVPAATAFGEGIYAIISTGRESHLAYVLTVPETLGAVQQQLGLAAKQGCFIVSTKNPAYPMPGGGSMVGGGPDYPKAISESFRARRWTPLRPEHLDYVHSHVLLIGESKGTDSIVSDEHSGRALSAELEELADDDLDRMRRLGRTEAEAVFASLHAKGQAKGQPELSQVFD